MHFNNGIQFIRMLLVPDTQLSCSSFVDGSLSTTIVVANSTVSIKIVIRRNIFLKLLVYCLPGLEFFFSFFIFFCLEFFFIFYFFLFSIVFYLLDCFLARQTDCTMMTASNSLSTWSPCSCNIFHSCGNSPNATPATIPIGS